MRSFVPAGTVPRCVPFDSVSSLDPSIALLRALQLPERSKSPPLLTTARAAGAGVPIGDVFAAAGTRNERDAPTIARRASFAGLVVGAVAEEEFQARYETAMAGQEFSFENQIAAASETDVLVRDALGRPAFRINIKAHGTRFQEAQRFVGLDPEDTFALATYKIRDALTKSEQEALPFLFAIVSSEVLATGPIGARLPADLAGVLDASTLYRGLVGWRTIENAMVADILARTDGPLAELVSVLREAVRSAEWRVISAQKAFSLMSDRLWQRVPAVAKRNFGGSPTSQPNMHFSFSQDMITLDDLLSRLSDLGIQHIATKIAFRQI